MIECENNFEDYPKNSHWRNFQCYLYCIVTEIPLYLGKMMLLCSYAVTSRLRAQDSVTDVSNPFSRYRTQWGKSPRAVAGMEWEEIGLTLDT